MLSANLLTGVQHGHDEPCPRERIYSMNSRKFSKSVAAAILAVSMVTIGAAPADAGTKDKAPTVQTKRDTGWG